MQSLSDLLSETFFFFFAPEHNKAIQLFRKEYHICISTICLITFVLKLLYLVSINYRGFAQLNVKLSAFVHKFMPYLLLCIFQSS